MKHVEVYSKNKFEKLVHLVGFVIRMYCVIWFSLIVTEFTCLLVPPYWFTGQYDEEIGRSLISSVERAW